MSSWKMKLSSSSPPAGGGQLAARSASKCGKTNPETLTNPDGRVLGESFLDHDDEVVDDLSVSSAVAAVDDSSP